MPGKLQSATNHPLVEPLEPPETSSAFQVHVSRVDDFFDRRVPSESNVAFSHVQYAHAACRNDTNGKVAVVYGYELHAFLLSAMQDGMLDRPSSLCLEFLVTGGRQESLASGRIVRRGSEGKGGCASLHHEQGGEN